VGALLEPLSVVAVAHEEEERVDAPLPGAREHRQEIVRPLHRGHPAEPSDDELPGRDPDPAPDLVRIPVEADARLELDPEPDDRELLPRRDVQPDELVADLGADRDQPVGEPREDRLDRAEHERARGPEVAAQHVPVEGVHHDRPAQAREQGRRAPHGARLGRVRVDHVGPELADQPCEAESRERVPHRRELAREP